MLPVWIAALTLVAATRPGDPVTFETDRPTPEKVALLVGVGAYPAEIHDEWQSLEGAVNDTERVRDLLVDRFGFDPADILVLTDEQATHENIVTAFHRWLIGRAGPRTEAVFWFSGHGSRVPDVSGAEEELDQLDASYLAYDSRTGGRDGEYDITDDEMRSLLIALTRKTPRVTVVTDSCFSGGGMRSSQRWATRSARPGTKGRREALPFWPDDVEYVDDDDPRIPDPNRYIHIAACSNRQPAYEWWVAAADGTSRCYGALTFFLSFWLEQASPGDSYRSIVRSVSRWISTRPDLHGQTVWCEGAIDRRLFDGSFKPRPPGFAAEMETRTKMVVSAGRLHGLVKGMRMRILNQSGEDLGQAEVFRVDAAYSLARWKGSVPQWAYDVPLRVVEEDRPAAREPLLVHVAESIRGSIDPDAIGIELQDEPTPDDYSLDVDDDGRLRLIAPGELPIWRTDGAVDAADPDAWLETLRTGVEHEQRFRAVSALAIEPGVIPLTGRFRVPTDEEIVGPPRV